MRIEYVHASRYGNGAKVAEEFRREMAPQGIDVEVRSIRDVDPDRLPRADLYVFSSPGRFGRPIRGMRRFLEKVQLPGGTKFALLSTELGPKPDKAGETPPVDRSTDAQQVVPVMRATLVGKGLVEVAEDKVFVTGLRGPLEEGWRERVQAFAARIPVSP